MRASPNNHGQWSRQERSGLQDTQRRWLMRVIFIITAVSLGIFGLFHLNAQHYWRAGIFAVGCVILCFGVARICVTPHVRLWIIGFLIPTYTFLLLLMILPESTDTVFVWAFIMPILSYLLLGRTAGLLVAAPFMVALAFFHINRYTHIGPESLIRLINPMACGLLILLFIHIYETLRADAQEKLVAQAETDALTGLPNRSTFRATLDRTLRESARSGSGFALVVLDIDHFKKINDTMGHDAGDVALQQLSTCLNYRLRSTDFVGRLGGEEFGLILRDVNADSAYQLVEELRQRIADMDVDYGGKKLKLTVTLGVAAWPEDGNTGSDLYQAADRRLYIGKHAGRNVVVTRDGAGTDAVEDQPSRA